jgi:hypothetical protein
MFGFGRSNRGRVRNDTFGSSKLGKAAIAGAGMLAWQWWRNRQARGQFSGQNKGFPDTSSRSYQGSEDREEMSGSGRF